MDSKNVERMIACLASKYVCKTCGAELCGIEAFSVEQAEFDIVDHFCWRHLSQTPNVRDGMRKLVERHMNMALAALAQKVAEDPNLANHFEALAIQEGAEYRRHAAVMSHLADERDRLERLLTLHRAGIGRGSQ